MAADFDVGMTPQQVQIRKLAGKLTQGANAAGSFDVSGTYDPATQNADLQLAAQALLAQLLQAAPQPDMSVTSGTVDLKAHVTQKQKAQAVTGSLALADFTGKFGKNELSSFGATMDLDADMTPQQIQVGKAAGKLTQGGKLGGSFDLTAKYDLEKKTADLTAKLVDFNQNGVGPFLQPMLADKKLVSVAINANATAQYDPQGASSVKGGLAGHEPGGEGSHGPIPRHAAGSEDAGGCRGAEASGQRAPVPGYANPDVARDQPGAVERPGGYVPDQRHYGEPQARRRLPGLYELLRLVHGGEAGSCGGDWDRSRCRRPRPRPHPLPAQPIRNPNPSSCR